MTKTISLRTVEGAEFDPPLLVDVDVPAVYDGGLILIGTDYYVWRIHHDQWRAATFVVDAT